MVAALTGNTDRNVPHGTAHHRPGLDTTQLRMSWRAGQSRMVPPTVGRSTGVRVNRLRSGPRRRSGPSGCPGGVARVQGGREREPSEPRNGGLPLTYSYIFSSSLCLSSRGVATSHFLPKESDKHVHVGRKQEGGLCGSEVRGHLLCSGHGGKNHRADTHSGTGSG